MTQDAANTLEIQCPKCSSTDVRSCDVLWREGTTTAHGSIVGGTFGGSGFQPAAASTHQESQTLLAKQCAPPKARGTWSVVWAMLFIVWGLNFLINSNWGLGVLAILLGAYSAWVYRQSLIYNRDEFPDVFRKWESTFVCSRCGEFVTASEPPKRSN